MDHLLATQKAALREHLRAVRRTLGSRADGPDLAVVLRQVLDAAGIADDALIAGFLPTALEPDVLVALASACRAAGTVVMPRTLPDSGLEWVVWTPESPLAADRHRLRAPMGAGDPTATARMRAILVPALAVDPVGHRLGQGGGYYDRELERLPRWPDGPLRIGVTHPEGMLDGPVPHAPHDESVDVAACATHWRNATL